MLSDIGAIIPVHWRYYYYQAYKIADSQLAESLLGDYLFNQIIFSNFFFPFFRTHCGPLARRRMRRTLTNVFITASGPVEVSTRKKDIFWHNLDDRTPNPWAAFVHT